MKAHSVHEFTYDKDSLAEMLNDCSIDRVLAIDNDWNIIAWNRTSELISGISRAEVIGKNLLETFPQINQDEEMLTAIKEAFNGRKSFLPANHATFNRTYSENHFIPLKDSQENVVGVMNIMHDVAHRIKVEKQLQKLNAELEKKYKQLEKASRELATFTSITTNDIKEPLKHVYTSLELLVKKEGHTLSNMSKGNLRRMQGSLNKMNLLLDDIITVSGINNNDEKVQQVDLNSILQHSLTKLRPKIEESGAEIESDTLPVIDGYPEMLKHLFNHLLDNAIKFHEPGKSPVVNISYKDVHGDESDNEALSTETTYAEISFTDNGIGFAQQEEERIFKMFEKLNDKRFHGSGIGLTLCKKIVEAHDGFTNGVSTPGEGSTFTCYLPVILQHP